jgi:signal transduction histidine kinase
MTGNLLLDWAIMAVSLFNTILLLWLGLTVLLTADQRPWGVWLVGGGLLVSGAFFVSHSAILGYGLHAIGQGLNFWWRLGWLPVVISPLAWYVAMLWYAGFWRWRTSQINNSLLGRQRYGLIITLVLAFTLFGLLVFANPLPSFIQVSQLQLSATPEVGGIPLLILVYPLYILLCIGLSLDALRHPAPSGRVMGDLARRRARPWLMAASIILLLVSLLVGWVMVWVVLNAQQRVPLSSLTNLAVTIGWFDLVIDLLIALAVISMGRAIVSYEVFTGKTLPRRGFFRHWRSAVILAAGYGLVVGGTIAIQLRPIYSLLLTTILMIAFYALFSWRSFVERDYYMNRLRPFVASQRLYEHLLAATPSTYEEELAGPSPFQALCAYILGARLAYLIPLGSLAPLIGATLTYPDNAPVLPHSHLPPEVHGGDPLLTGLSPQTMCLPLDPAHYGGALWAVPLWSERGLIGLLLLGEKRDGGLYTQEEMEIARASGERLIDTQASVELARRLMALQRQRLTQTQILDRQTRRVLHDDILPSLHTAMLILSNDQRPKTEDRRREYPSRSPVSGPRSAFQQAEVIALLTTVHHQISDLLHEMPAAVASEVSRLGLVAALRRAVDDELSRAFDEVVWLVEPEAEEKARAIPALTAEVLFYAAREAIRNAAHHARADAAGPLHLQITIAWRDDLEITIEDNGVGVGAAPSANGGSGQGLALHSTMMAVAGGTLAVESTPGAYTRVTLTLPQATQPGGRL